MITIYDYVEYFKALAVNHPNLRHSDTSGQRAFSTLYIQELLGNMRNKLVPKGYCLHLIHYTAETQDNVNLNDIARQGGFIIQGFSKAGDWAAKTAMESSCERIAYEILVRMRDDSQQNVGIWNNSLDSLNGVTIQPWDFGLEGYTGYAVNFNFVNDLDICTADVGWLDIES